MYKKIRGGRPIAGWALWLYVGSSFTDIRETRAELISEEPEQPKEGISVAENLESKRIQFKSLKDNIDTTSSAGRFFFHMMASLAQMERELIAELTKAGLEAARKLGRIGGRPEP